MVWSTEEGDDVGDNVGQSTGTRQQEGAPQAAVSLTTVLTPQEGKGITTLPPPPPLFMIIVSPEWLGLTLAMRSTVQWFDRLDGLDGLMGFTA
jgi:hypothetical protein